MKKSNAVLLGTAGLIWISVALYALGFRGDDPDFKDLDFVYTESTVDLTVGVNPDGRVQINNMGGRIDITCWDKDSVQVTGTLQKKVKEVKVASDGHTATVMVIYYDKKNGWQIAADLEIKIPRRCRITVNSISADIDIKDHQGGSVLAHTVSGDVICRSDASDVDVKSVSGNLRLRGHGRKAVFSQVSGNFTATGNYAEVSGHSVSGDISVTSDTGAVYDLKSTSGDIAVACVIAEEVRMNLKTISGDIKTDFARIPHVSYALRSTSGTISGYMYGPDGTPRRFRADKFFNTSDEGTRGMIAAKSTSGDITLEYSPAHL